MSTWRWLCETCFGRWGVHKACSSEGGLCGVCLSSPVDVYWTEVRGEPTPPQQSEPVLAPQQPSLPPPGEQLELF